MSDDTGWPSAAKGELMGELLMPIAVLATIVGFIMLLFKGSRQDGLKALAAGIALIGYETYRDSDARGHGFASSSDFRRAKQHGITDPAAWKVKAADLEVEDRRKAKRAGVVTGTGLETIGNCTRWENVQICRHQPADGLPDYLFYKVQPTPNGGCVKGIERWAQGNDIDPDWINISVLVGATGRCEFNQVPVRMRSIFEKAPAPGGKAGAPK